MEETYTLEDAMIQMIYRELEAGDVLELQAEMDDLPALCSIFDELLLAKAHLPKVQFNPASATLRNILQYSTQTTQGYLN
jgi:hypothetical protein